MTKETVLKDLKRAEEKGDKRAIARCKKALTFYETLEPKKETKSKDK